MYIVLRKTKPNIDWIEGVESLTQAMNGLSWGDFEVFLRFWIKLRNQFCST